MELSIVQIFLLTLIGALKTVEWATTQFTAFNTILYGWLAGLICGDAATGLQIGATMQLMSMGVVAVGGSSMPDYPVSAIIATTIAITTGQGMEAGLAIGLPVAMLCVNLDVIIKILNGFIATKAEGFCEQKKFNKMLRTILISPFIYTFSAGLPVFVCVTLGPTVVNSILEFMPAWFTSGLNIAGGLLPAVGISMLLMYMPTKKYWSFLLIGFMLSSYLAVPVLGVAMVGLAAAYEVYKNQMKASTASLAAVAGGLEDE